MPVLARNKKAFHDYFIEDKLEAGIELVGTEVKSVKAGKVSIKESFIRIIRDEVFVMNMHITPYEFGNINNVAESRVRKLLLNRREIKKWSEKIKEQGYTIVPLKAYFSRDKIKLEIGLAKGKKLYDKRDTNAKKVAQREIERALKSKQRGE